LVLTSRVTQQLAVERFRVSIFGVPEKQPARQHRKVEILAENGFSSFTPSIIQFWRKTKAPLREDILEWNAVVYPNELIN